MMAGVWGGMSSHTTDLGAQLYVKIKSHQFRPDGTPKYITGLQSCLALLHNNHWIDKTCELPNSVPNFPLFPLTCIHCRTALPLYCTPMTMYCGLYCVDIDAYQNKLILWLATKSEMRWYAWNMPELQPPNRTIGFTGPTRQLITH